MGRAIGIDLGTTNSVVTILDGHEPQVVVNAEGYRTTPSIVAVTPSGDVLVGEVAHRQGVTNPTGTLRSIKRQMGSDWSVDIAGQTWTPQEVSARILAKLKRDAETFLGEDVTDAVITVPAYFDDAQRTATIEAGRIAGLTVLRIINEPTAAALAYSMDRAGDAVICIFDLGGGTFDVSILEITAGMVEVRATAGDTALGGDDFDDRMVELLLAGVRKTNPEMVLDKVGEARLRESAERAKRELSSVARVDISLPYLGVDLDGPVHLTRNLSRSEYEHACLDLVAACGPPLRQALADAGIAHPAVSDSAGQDVAQESGTVARNLKIDRVVLVGGSTRLPSVVEFVRAELGLEPTRGVSPDEVVAIGAAIQAGVLTGTIKDVLLLDVTPLALGIETAGGVLATLIDRNTTIPTRRSEVFTTSEDGQQSVAINVYQGERSIAMDNAHLGTFSLTGIEPAPRGRPKIEVTFDIDADGLVHVAARDVETGREQSMVATGTSALSEERVAHLVTEAVQHAHDDRARVQFAERANGAEHVCYDAESLMANAADVLTAGMRAQVEGAITVVRQRCREQREQPLMAAVETLTDLMSAIGRGSGQHQPLTSAPGVEYVIAAAGAEDGLLPGPPVQDWEQGVEPAASPAPSADQQDRPIQGPPLQEIYAEVLPAELRPESEPPQAGKRTPKSARPAETQDPR